MVNLFQERFAAINNDIVLNNTRVSGGPITWQVCVTNKFITIYVTGFVKTRPNRTRTEIQFTA